MGSKMGKLLQLCGREHYRATGKNLDSRTQLDEPAKCTSAGDPLLLYKILHLLFSPPVRLLCALNIDSRKKLSTWSRCGTFGISVPSAEGMSHQPIQNSVAFFGVIGKTPGIISHNNFVNRIFCLLRPSR